MALILNQSQAEAVYSAMCALNNVGGRVQATFGDRASESVHAFEKDCGSVRVVQVRRYRVVLAENYPNQSAFATAYGLDHGGEPQSAVAAAAGGITQTAIER